MKNFLKEGSLFLLATLTFFTLQSQNPNWTIPNNYFDHNLNGTFQLPQPTGSSWEVYQGEMSANTHGAYTDPNGEVMFFTVDEVLYDRNGYVVGEFYDVNYSYKRGYTERLILPMGNDCSRYAILYTASSRYDEDYLSQLSKQRLYMAIYDLDEPNIDYPQAIGNLDFGSNTYTLEDISKRDGPLHNTAAYDIYGYSFLSDNQTYNSNFQIASTELIDNCYFRVFIFDGEHLMKYRLDELGFHYDGVVVQVPGAQWESNFRSEMELINIGVADQSKSNNFNYRIAIPKQPNGASGIYGIALYDLDPTGAIIPGSFRDLDYGSDANGDRAEPYGLEFNSTGDYLYVTHEVNLDHPTPLSIYDYANSNFISPTLPGIINFIGLPI